MHYFLWLSLEGFYAGGLGAEAPGIVTRGKAVLDANREARRRGVRPGLTVRQARALVEGCVAVPWVAEDYEKAQRAWLDLCADFTGTIEPEDQHAATLDLSGHPNPVDVAERLIRRLIERTDLSVRYGLAPGKWIAKLAARDEGLSVEDPARFLAPRPVSDLLPARPEQRERLKFLGYHTLGQVAEIPLPVLQAHFGAEAHLILRAAQGRYRETVRPLYPPDSLRECFVFDGAVEDAQTVDAALRELAGRIGRRLGAQGMQSAKAELAVGFEEGDWRRLSRRFTHPVHSARTALAGLRLLLPDSIDRPVDRLRIALEDLERVPLHQNSLEGLAPVESRHRRAEDAFRYVRTVYGDRSIQRGSEIEAPRRVRVLREWQHATGWR